MKKPLIIPVGPKKAAPNKPVKKDPRRSKAVELPPTVIEVGDCCGNCKFFLESQNPTEGACRRYPPVPLATMGGISNHFPGMQSIGWCGEFKDKKVPVAE